jgi:hypothetical protein
MTEIKMENWQVTKFSGQESLIVWDCLTEKEARAFARRKNASSSDYEYYEVSEMEGKEK